MTGQARTFDTLLVKSREMTGRAQRLPWYLMVGRRGKDDRKQNILPVFSAGLQNKQKETWRTLFSSHTTKALNSVCNIFLFRHPVQAQREQCSALVVQLFPQRYVPAELERDSCHELLLLVLLTSSSNHCVFIIYLPETNIISLRNCC